MPHKKMKPEARKSQLLDCAQAQFFEKGYEHATINDIMAMAGVSKGGFYHHFASKDEVLEALSARLAEEGIARVKDVLDDPRLSALERLNRVLSKTRQMKRKDAPLLLATFQTIFRPENVVLYHRLHRAVMAVMLPVFTEIIEQGRAEGTFDVFDAPVSAEIILRLGTMTHDAVADAIAARGTKGAARAATALEHKLRMQGVAMDRILGLPDGSVKYVERGFVAALLATDPPHAAAAPARTASSTR